MAFRLGWQDQASMERALMGAAAAAAIAGSSEIFETHKRELKEAAPVGEDKPSAHFGAPTIPGGSIRSGGRTRSSINFARPRIDVDGAGGSVSRLTISADVVMAPQGYYQNQPGKARSVKPVNRLTLAWVGPTGRAVFRSSALVIAGGGHVGWIESALSQEVVVSQRMEAAFSHQFTGAGKIRPQRALVLSGGFIDQATTGAWYGENTPRSVLKDLSWRRTMQAASRRAAGVWDNQVNAAIARF